MPDPTIDIPTPTGGDGDDNTTGEITMSDALNLEAMNQTMVRFNDNSAFVAAESKQSFVIRQMLAGATAQNLLEKEGLADSLMQLKSAGNFPPNTNIQPG